ncbi:hypothetical protein RLDS_08020 [Sphingobium lactosutens DS20]|uniref:Uncharacterized protein n=1 Tax=Sphingobium lactosutens DS20 TaxID=1331060 RepID=T0HW87_9SPHN|nr:hypothetical protein RLDS_08020 [Sphingobium lactosutens DS20]
MPGLTRHPAFVATIEQGKTRDQACTEPFDESG